jgi:release factor glutamine methyltransferase
MLARAGCREPAAGRVLELCAGPALAGIAVARAHGARLTTVDISRRAAINAALNGWLNGLRVRPRRGDLFAPVAGQRFGLILANPPYLPGPPAAPRGARRAWEGGADGRSLIDRICRDAPAHLDAGGALLLVHSEVCDAAATLSALAAAGLRGDVVHRHRGGFGPLVRARRAQLEAAGRLRRGQTTEEVLVIRGAAS